MAGPRAGGSRRPASLLLLIGLVALAGCGGSTPAGEPAPGAPELSATATPDGVALRFAPRTPGTTRLTVQRRTCARCPWTTVRRLDGAARGLTDRDGLPGAALGHRVIAEGADGVPRVSAATRTDVGGEAELGFVSGVGRVTDGDVTVGESTRWLRRLRREGGATTVRLDFDTAGVDTGDASTFRDTDRLAETAARAGVDVIAIVQPRFDGDRPWAAASFGEEATGALATDPAVRAAYARAAAALVGRYGTRGTFWRAARARGVPRRPITRWQVGNEPWFDGFGISEDGARRFSDVVAAVAPAMRAEDPVHARILMPTADGLVTSSYVRWARAALSGGRAARLRGLVDAVTAHPYAFPVVRDGRTEAPRVSRCVARADDEADHARSFCRVRSLRADLVAADPGGFGELPIWITELGLATCAPRPGQDWTDPDRCVDDGDQARGVTEAFALLRRWTAEPGARALRLAGLTWFSDVDTAERGSTDPATFDPLFFYGLFRRTAGELLGGPAKPAWAVWRREAARGIPAGP